MTVKADIMRDQRRRFAKPGGSHDRLVKLLRTWLPGGIGALVAVMVLSPLATRGDVSFLLDRNKVAITQERLRVDRATYRGMDSDLRPFQVTAGSAVQPVSSDPVVQMRNLVADIQLKDGPAKLEAPGGAYNFDTEKMRVGGQVDFTAADGYHMVTRNVTIDLKERRVTGDGGVDGVIPSGTFTARRISADLAERTVTLDGNARLRMEPGKLRMPQ